MISVKQKAMVLHFYEKSDKNILVNDCSENQRV